MENKITIENKNITNIISNLINKKLSIKNGHFYVALNKDKTLKDDKIKDNLFKEEYDEIETPSEDAIKAMEEKLNHLANLKIELKSNIENVNLSKKQIENLSSIFFCPNYYSELSHEFVYASSLISNISLNSEALAFEDNLKNIELIDNYMNENKNKTDERILFLQKKLEKLRNMYILKNRDNLLLNMKEFNNKLEQFIDLNNHTLFDIETLKESLKTMNENYDYLKKMQNYYSYDKEFNEIFENIKNLISSIKEKKYYKYK
jgi:hypothetical protein